MACADNGLIKKLIEKLMKCEEELEVCDNELQPWTESLEELSIIKEALVTEENDRLYGKTVLDIGTDCVKPLYIALKFEPDKIVGIDEKLPSIASDIKMKSRFLTKTKIVFYNCNLFDEEGIRKICEKEGQDSFDFVVLCKTLHHLRTKECIRKKRDKKHKHQEDETEKCCIYGFDEEKIFDSLLKLGRRVVIYEGFFPQEEDEDKVRGRGGYFTRKELKGILTRLSEKYKVEFIRPQLFHLGTEILGKIDSMLRKVDIVCFYVEKEERKNSIRPITNTEC